MEPPHREAPEHTLPLTTHVVPAGMAATLDTLCRAMEAGTQGGPIDIAAVYAGVLALIEVPDLPPAPSVPGAGWTAHVLGPDAPNGGMTQVVSAAGDMVTLCRLADGRPTVGSWVREGTPPQLASFHLTRRTTGWDLVLRDMTHTVCQPVEALPPGVTWATPADVGGAPAPHLPVVPPPADPDPPPSLPPLAIPAGLVGLLEPQPVPSAVPDARANENAARTPLVSLPVHRPTEEPPPTPAVRIVFATGPTPFEDVPLTGRVVIGRDADCDLQLDDPGVSRHHAAVEPTPAGARVTDLGSSNGTYLNRRRLEAPAAVREGDEIVVGHSYLVLARGHRAVPPVPDVPAPPPAPAFVPPAVPLRPPEASPRHCTRCGHAEPDAAMRFCRACGQALGEATPRVVPTCAGCGRELHAGESFCTWCGHKAG